MANTRRGTTLSRAAIVAAARDIADTDGIGELTLRRVATALDTGQASLYRHIADRAELLSLLVEDFGTDLPLVSAQPSAVATVLHQWQAMHDHLARHPWAAPVIAQGQLLAHSAHHVTAHSTAQLRRAGLDAHDADRAYRALWHLLLGHLLNEHPLGHGHEGQSRQATRAPRDGEADFHWALRRLVNGMVMTSPPTTRGDSG